MTAPRLEGNKRTVKKHGANLGVEGGSELNGHEEFLELCAFLTGGGLTDEERRRLESHLEVCSACCNVLKDYRKIAATGMPALAPDFVPEDSPDAGMASIESVKRKLFEHLTLDSEPATDRRYRFDPATLPANRGRRVPQIRRAQLRLLWKSQTLLRCAAAVLLVVGLTASAYRLGEKRVARVSNAIQPVSPKNGSNLPWEVTAFAHERQALDTQLRERDQAIKSLSSRISQQMVDIARFQETEKALQDEVVTARAQKTQVALDRDGVSQQLRTAQSDLKKMQEELDNLRKERTNDLFRAADLEARLGELAGSLKDRDDMITQQQQLLASDRDIRELMGARELYIAEVYDVARNGQTQKPFGRVFFTKNKSLIFYAYDLDQQPGVSAASAFQAWGRRGPDRKHSVSLGIFYVDNATNKRWVLKVDDPKSLQQIDAVFVTVEPSGGSQKPSDKQLLFAYLRVTPNHP
jgi:predicted  nucleic acid-binding Zn-ribbon protein